MTTSIAFALLFLLACAMAGLQIYVRRRLRHNATHFVRSGASLADPVDRWTVAVVARYLMPLELPVDSFRPPESRRVPMLTSMLARDWGVKDRVSLLPVIDHLRSTGHRAYCASVSGRAASDFLAWDLMRLVLLTWAAFNLGWLNREEFLNLVSSAGAELQKQFADWASAAASYEAGLVIWAAQGKVPRVARSGRLTLQTLLHDPQSPWVSTPWQTPLTATIAE